MTDTGQIPGEGQPESAGGQPEAHQQGVQATGSYPYGVGVMSGGGEEELLLPGAHGAWSDVQAGAAQSPYGQQPDVYGQSYGQQDPYGHQGVYVQQAPHPQGQQVVPGQQQYAPTPSHVPGPHEMDGRDSGSIDVAAVRASAPGGQEAPAAADKPVPHPPRRPLHLGPPEPAQSGAVRPLSDRNPTQGADNSASAAPGSAPAPSPQPAHAGRPERGSGKRRKGAPKVSRQSRAKEPQPEFTPQQGPATYGPEYLDIAHQSADVLPGPQLGALPPENDQWAASQTGEAGTAEPPQEYPAGPQLAPTGGDINSIDPSQVPAGPGEAGEVHALPPESVPAAEVQEVQEEQPQPGPAEAGDVQQAPGGNSAADNAIAESTGNTWVSTPGSTAVEPIEPQVEAAEAPVVEQEQPQSQEQPQTQQQAPEQAQNQGDLDTTSNTPASPPAPVPVQGGDAVAEIPAQQQADPAANAAVDTPESEAGQQEAQVTVPRQGKHAQPDPAPAAPQEVPAAESESGTEPGTEAGAAAESVPVPAAEPEAVTAPPIDAGAAEGEAEGQGAPANSESGPEAEPVAAPKAEPVAVAAPEPVAAAESAPESVPRPETAEQAQPPAGPPAPGFADDERDAVHRLMRERRDIRNGFRPDPIPHEVLLRVLEAAHTAPSVGHSQPWDFVVIRSEETRRAMHELAQRQRDAYAESLPKGRAKQFKELKIEAILDTPVNIVVTADPTRGGRHTLGRHTQPQMAPYSSALAVENLWLAARAEGLGVGWVSFFDEREMVQALELPEHLEVVAYLCVGYVDEFPPEPELAQAGWSKRRPLSWVVHEESYGRRVLPGAEPQDLLADTVAAIRPLDAKALGEAWERQKRMTKPSGALGMLEIISAQLCGLSRKCPPPMPEPAAVAIFAADHGVHAQGVTPWPQEVTAQMVANFLGGGAVCNAFANQVGAEVCVIDVGVAGELPSTPGLLPRKVRAGTGDVTQGPALTREEALRAVEVGIETARDLVAAGNKALLTGEMGIANTTVSAALISVCTGTDPAEVTGRGTGIDDETHALKVDVVRRALELHQPDPDDPLGLLAAIGGLEHAALVGLILGGASLRTPVILDGVSAGAAALIARRVAPEALAACIAGHRSTEPGHVAALTKLGLRPLVDLDLRLGEGTGALLSLPLVQSAARAMHEVATFDSAGVTGKS